MSDTSDTRNLMASNQPMGARLKVAREKAGWSQRELAQRLGVELDSIAAWERDDREPRANRIMMLCGVLGVTLKWLLEGHEDEQMAQDETLLPVIRAELERLRSMLEEATALADALCARTQSLEP